MQENSRFSTIEERIGFIKGIVEPLPRDINNIYERLNNIDKDLVQLKNDAKAAIEKANNIEKHTGSIPVFDENKFDDICEQIEGICSELESQQIKIDAKNKTIDDFIHVVKEEVGFLKKDYDSRQQIKSDWWAFTKRAFSYAGNQIITVAITLLLAYLTWKLKWI